jgi:hypothetical protein
MCRPFAARRASECASRSSSNPDGNQGCEIILDFVTDNKYYFTGNILSRAIQV